MSNNNVESVENAASGTAPKPWEQQPGEPLDRFRWFQIYVTLPVPRVFARVAQAVGMNPRSSWVSKTAREWRWKERAEALDAQRAAQLAVQSEWRNHLLREIAFEAQFQGLEETNRALGAAAVGEMDRAEARKYLGPLSQHQRGLLRLIMHEKETGELQIDEEQLELLVEQRAREIYEQKINTLLQQVYNQPDSQAETGHDDSPHVDKVKESQI